MGANGSQNVAVKGITQAYLCPKGAFALKVEIPPLVKGGYEEHKTIS